MVVTKEKTTGFDNAGTVRGEGPGNDVMESSVVGEPFYFNGVIYYSLYSGEVCKYLCDSKAHEPIVVEEFKEPEPV
jgi:hypothetical protein